MILLKINPWTVEYWIFRDAFNPKKGLVGTISSQEKSIFKVVQMQAVHVSVNMNYHNLYKSPI